MMEKGTKRRFGLHQRLSQMRRLKIKRKEIQMATTYVPD